MHAVRLYFHRMVLRFYFVLLLYVTQNKGFLLATCGNSEFICFGLRRHTGNGMETLS